MKQSVLITGASSGIGKALAEAYAKPGVFLTLMGRDEKRLREIAELCELKGAVIEIASVDVRDADTMKESIRQIDSQYPIDLVIANAGISLGDNLETLDNVHNIIDINVQGVMNTVLPIIPLMEARGQGHIAIMSSLAALRGLPSRSTYAASKAAVKAFGEAKRVELKPNGITVTNILPGFVKTPLTAKNKFAMPFQIPAKQAARIIKRGLEKRKRQIAFPLIPYVFMRFLSILPPILADFISSKIQR